ncbi:MAG TPA: pseudouridine synthase [Rectinemataceae bacterium]|nr:pseudouridine synthase [Rectinemataceae bacterium]
MDEALGSAAEEPHIVVVDDAIIVAWKPHRMHCAELPASRGGPSLAAWVYSRFPETAPSAFAASHDEADRETFPDGGLLHRLDFETAGLVLFARNPRALRSLRLAQANDAIEKTYRLLCSPSGGGLAGSTPLRGRPAGLEEDEWAACLAGGKLAETISAATIESRFRPYGPRGARVACLEPDFDESDKARRGSPDRTYVTRIRVASLEAEGLGAIVSLTRGFRHQIRAHFAWIGLPLFGDGIYGREAGAFLSLVATEIRLDHPETGLPLRIRDNSIASPSPLA